MAKIWGNRWQIFLKKQTYVCVYTLFLQIWPSQEHRMTTKSILCSRINPNWFIMLTLSQRGATGLQSVSSTRPLLLTGAAKVRQFCAMQSILFLSTGSSQRRCTHFLTTSSPLHSGPHFLKFSLLSMSGNLKVACSQPHELISPKHSRSFGLGLVVPLFTLVWTRASWAEGCK